MSRQPDASSTLTTAAVVTATGGAPVTTRDPTEGRGPNPFVGPRALAEGQPLFGRDREIRELRQLVTSERIVLLYSPSGAGKTSLVQAGLRGEMREHHFDPLPTTRVGSVATATSANRYLTSVLRSLGSDPALDDAPGALEVALADLGHKGGHGNPLLIIDQFEELFSTNWTDQAAKEAFMRELGVVLRDHDRFAIIAMREDYIAQLDPYLSLIPTRLAARYRLSLLGPEAASDAAVRTAASANITMSGAVVDAIVNDLRRVRVGGARTADPASVFGVGPFVEPVHLQVVCKRLVDCLPEDANEITDLSAVAATDVDESLAAFYDDAIGHVPGANERDARDWCEAKLITADRIRAQTLDGPGVTGADALTHLEQSHLIRGDERQGTTWYELAHDRLVDPILQSNRRFRTEHLTVLERVAPIWEGQHRSARLLLAGRDLRAARPWAREHRDILRPAEHDLLRASVRRQRSRRALSAVAALLTVSLVTLVVARITAAHRFAELQSALARVATHSALNQTDLAAHALRKVEAQRLAAASTRALASDAELAALLALEAAKSDADAAKDALVGAAYGLDSRPLLAHGLEVTSVAFDPSGGTLASASLDGTLRLWDVARREPIGVIAVGSGGVNTVAFAPDGSTLATGDLDGRVRLYDSASRRVIVSFTPAVGEVTVVAFSGDGTSLAVAGTAGVQLVDLTTGPRPFVVAAGRAVDALALSPDGTMLATGGSSDWVVHLWDARTGASIGDLKDHLGDITSLAFSPDGKQLASVSADRTGRVWDVAARRPVISIVGHTKEVYALAFTGDSLVTGGLGGSVRSWDPATGNQRRPLLQTAGGPVFGLALGPDGCLTASAGGGNAVHLWSRCYERLTAADLTANLRQRVARELTPDERTTYALPSAPGTSAPSSTTASTTASTTFSTTVSTTPTRTSVNTSPPTAPLSSSSPTPPRSSPSTTTPAGETSVLVRPTPPPTLIDPVTIVAPEFETRTIGTSVRGVPILAFHRGRSSGNTVVAIGAVHGDHPAGLGVVQELRTAVLPPGLDLWIIDTINPDGLTDGTRTNAHLVDLNRNFAASAWHPTGEGSDTWTGAASASEPETQALQSFLATVQPRLVVWWDQFRSALVDYTAAARQPVVERYADVAQLQVQPANCAPPSCIGNLSTYVHEQFGASAFVVSLPPDVDAKTHVAALFAAAQA